SLTGEWRKSLPSAKRMHVIRVPISAPTYGSVNGRSITQRLGARFRGARSMGKKYNHSAATRPEKMLSALPPKADKQEKARHVRFVPKADIRIAANSRAIRSPRRRGRAAWPAR